MADFPVVCQDELRETASKSEMPLTGFGFLFVFFLSAGHYARERPRHGGPDGPSPLDAEQAEPARGGVQTAALRRVS